MPPAAHSCPAPRARTAGAWRARACRNGRRDIDLLRSAPRCPAKAAPCPPAVNTSPDVSTVPHAASDALRAQRDEQLAQLMQRAATGDAAAFEQFHDATVGYAQGLARRMVPAADLEDVLSDAYFQAWRDAARFDAARGGPVTWLLTLVRSRALDLLRHQRSTAAVECHDPHADDAPADAPGPQDLLSALESGCALHAALAALSAQERWLLGLAYYRELSHAQISSATGLPLGTVKSAILRAQGKLRDTLAAHRRAAP